MPARMHVAVIPWGRIDRCALSWASTPAVGDHLGVRTHPPARVRQRRCRAAAEEVAPAARAVFSDHPVCALQTVPAFQAAPGCAGARSQLAVTCAPGGSAGGPPSCSDRPIAAARLKHVQIDLRARERTGLTARLFHGARGAGWPAACIHLASRRSAPKAAP
jgi:hypothetical protein